MTYADHTFHATTSINASPEAIWPILVDVAAWPSWDSGIVAATGTAERVGAKLAVTSGAAPKQSFAVKVTKVDPAKELVIVGGAPLGLFKGVRTFTLVPEGTSTRFTMHEIYSGPLLGAIWKQIPDLDPSFQQFADGLKAKAEGKG